MSDWIKINLADDQTLPPEDEVVLTLSEGGTERKLIRRGYLWFIPDQSVYVYYTPEYWKRLDMI